MTIQELIKQLQALPTDDHVFMWVDGHRYPITRLEADSGDNFVDLKNDK